MELNDPANSQSPVNVLLYCLFKGGHFSSVDLEMGVRVHLRELSVYGRFKMASFREKLPGPQFGVRLRELSVIEGSTVLATL